MIHDGVAVGLEDVGDIFDEDGSEEFEEDMVAQEVEDKGGIRGEVGVGCGRADEGDRH